MLLPNTVSTRILCDAVSPILTAATFSVVFAVLFAFLQKECMAEVRGGLNPVITDELIIQLFSPVFPNSPLNNHVIVYPYLRCTFAGTKKEEPKLLFIDTKSRYNYIVLITVIYFRHLEKIEP